MSSRILLAVLVPIAVISTAHGADPVAGREKVQQCQTCEQMSIIAEGLSDEDIADIAACYSSIQFSVTLPQ